VALRDDPSMKPLTALDVSKGLPASAAASALLGKSGAVAILVLLFLAVTSACSAELIAVSSLLTYDVYKTYIDPNATEERILRMGHLMVGVYAIVCGLAGLIFFYIGVSLGWLYTFMGVILGSGVIPIALCITWSKANKWGCISGAVIGFAAGVIAWLVTTAKLNDGVINVVTTGGDYEMLAGNIASFIIGGLIATITSFLFPENFDWVATRSLNAPSVYEEADAARKTSEDAEKEDAIDVEPASANETSIESTQREIDAELNPEALRKAFLFASASSILLFVVLILVIPLPLFFAQTVYTAKGYTGWVAVGIAWVFCSVFTVVLYPIYESRHALIRISRGLCTDLFTKESGKYLPSSREIA